MFATTCKVLVLGCALVVTAPVTAQKANDEKVCSAGGCETELRKLTKLARNGSGYAAAIVAMAYATGDGVEQSNAEAERFLKMGVRSRDAFSMYLMSDWLSRGFIVEKDDSKAEELLDKAVSADFAPAQYSKAVQLLQSSLPDDQHNGLALLERAAETKLVDAMFLLARLKHTGAGMLQDLEGAGELYKRLVSVSYPDAQVHLDDVVEQLAAQQGETTLVAELRSVKDIEIITVTGSRDASFNMLNSIARRLDSSGLYDSRSIGSKIKGVTCENSGSNCSQIKPDGSSGSISQALSGGR